MVSPRRFLLLLDRTAVLAVGIVAGFAIGLSFNAAGRQAVVGWLFPGSAPAPLPYFAEAPAAPGKAAPAPELAGAVDTQAAARVREAGMVRVGVFGDSFGDGVWVALYNQLPTKHQFKVLRFSKEGTGFTRYRQIDLEQRARTQIAAEPIDVAVISFGANDVQPIFSDGHLHALLDPGWQNTIGERVDRFIAVARSTGAQVYWVGLPVMRDPVMDANIRAMDAFFRHHAEALGVPYIDVRAASLGPHGEYSPYLPDRKGEPKLMRTGDGVHMTIPGYIRLTAGLAQRIRDYAALLRTRAGLPPQPTPTPNPTPAPKPTTSARHRDPAPDDSHATASANRHERKRHGDALDDAPSPRPSHGKR